MSTKNKLSVFKKTEAVDKATGNSYKYYEARRPEITNTVFDAKFTAFLPSNVMTFGGNINIHV